MCIALLQKIGAAVSIDTLRICAQNNPDGAGYSFVMNDANGKPFTKVVKALHWSQIEKQYKKDYRRHGGNSPFLVHFRIASHGAVCYENCHPFKVADGAALIHNGMLSFYDRDKSDTAQFAEFMGKMPANWADDPDWIAFMEDAIGKGNKIAFLWPDKRTLILNEKQGHWTEDVWYSNYSCNARVTTPGTWSDANRPKVPSTTTGHQSTTNSASNPGGYGSWKGKTAQQRWADFHDFPDAPVDDGQYHPAKHWNGIRQRFDMPVTEPLILPEPKTTPVIVDKQMSMTPAVDEELSERESIQREIAEIVKENESFIERTQLGLVSISGRDFCAKCGEDLTTSWAKSHHDEKECNDIAQFVAPPRLRPMGGGRIINGSNGRHVVQYDL